MRFSCVRYALRSTRCLRQCNLNQVLSDAERLVGYSGSHLGLKCLLTDEVANVAVAASKLIGTNHPLLKTAKHLLSSGNEAIQQRGLLILLITKASNVSTCDVLDLKNQGAVDGILANQRNIAEISELIWTASLLHNGCLDVQEMPKDLYAKLTAGNKMAILGGDFLLANASQALAKLGYPKVTNRIAGSIGHMSESAFIKIDSLQSWEKFTYLETCSLLSSSVWSCLEICQNNDSTGPELREKAVNLANNIALLLAVRDLMKYRNDKNFPVDDDEDNMKSLEFLGTDSILRRRKELFESCKEDLKVFAVSDSVLAIENMVDALVVD